MNTAPDGDEISLAAAVRSRRGLAGWSLRDLSERSGVSAAMLSDIERGTKSPTVRLAYQIARALECSITDLLVAPNGASQVTGATRSDARRLGDAAAGVERASYPGPLLHGRLEVVVYGLAPGASTGTMTLNRPGTLETVVALDGSVEIVLDAEPTRVEAGGSVSHGVHATEYRNPSTTEACRFLVLVDSTRT